MIKDARAEAYTTEASVSPGGTLQVHVSTSPAASYRLEVYRLGWYGGRGGRLMLCVPGCSSSEQGAPQPTPPPEARTGELVAGWPVTDRIHVGAAWVSGLYEVKLVPTNGPGAGSAALVPFVVTQAPGARPSAVVVDLAVATWQAYNNWGGKSLYDFNSSGGQQAVKVSFERPYADITNMGPYSWDVNLIRFLERSGVDVSYVTDVDIDRHPQLLLHHRVAIVSGHDEYWSSSMRNAWQAARRAGVDLMFMGADIASWQARFEDRDHTLVEYRSAAADPDPNPAQKTVQFTALTPPRPACALTGVQFSAQEEPGAPAPPYTLVRGALPSAILSATGLHNGQVFPDLVGYEYDAIVPGCKVPGVLHPLLSYGAPPRAADAVYYWARSGSLVLSAGSMQFSWALDNWGETPHVQPALKRLIALILTADGGAQRTGFSYPRAQRLIHTWRVWASRNRR